MEQVEYLDNYENSLLDELVNLCIGDEKLSQGRLLQSDDITLKWDEVSPSYIKDALQEVNDYPTVALGWAMYVGMAVANYWDDDWNIYGKHPNLYEHIRDKRGFDYLDEVVRDEILKLDDKNYTEVENLVRKCSRYANERIHHEQIEPSSVTAFYVFTRSIYVLYRVGAAVELNRLGYKMSQIK